MRGNKNLSDLEKIMLHNARKIGTFSGGIAGFVSACVNYLLISSNFLGVVVKSVAFGMMVVSFTFIALCTSNLIVSSFASRMSTTGKEVYKRLKIRKRITIWTLVFYFIFILLLIILKYVIKLI